MKLAGASLNQIPLDWKGNKSRIVEAIAKAKLDDVDILCLPELCITGYGCEDMFLSDWVPEKSLDILKQIIPKSDSICVVIGLPFAFENAIYNCCAIIKDCRIIGIYAKRHLAKEGVHYEPRWFESWPKDRVEFFSLNNDKFPFGHIDLDINGIKVGFEICEDAWRMERPADKYVDKSVDLILNPSASHFAFGKAAFREHLVKESSKKFYCYYLYTNLLGNESGRMIFDGDIILAGHGELIQRNRRLSFEDINLVSVDIDFNTRSHAESLLTSDFDSQNEEFTAAASLALFDYLRKSRSNGFVLSLSGGADSSTCAVLVAEMVRRCIEQLGIEVFLIKSGLKSVFKDAALTEKQIVNRILFTAYQGTTNSSEATFNSAQNLASSLNAKFYNWNIDDEVNTYSAKIATALGKELNWETDDITLQNIQARARSPIIWMIANIKNCLLLTTSNRSEGDVGYATMDGDTSGSLAPIAAVDKPFILQWLKWAETELGYSGLREVNSLQPTAELRPPGTSQTDEKDLMPYEILLKIERLAIRDKLSPKQVYVKLAKDSPNDQLSGWIKKFFRLWSRNQWKRERIAPSFHFDDFNVDPRSWMRFPILSSGFEEELRQLDEE
ncbi:MAG: NAD(+) synthase [Cyclobacteriaceae bacterium]